MICFDKPEPKSFNYMVYTGDNLKELEGFAKRYYRDACIVRKNDDDESASVVDLVWEWYEWFEGFEKKVPKGSYVVVKKKNSMQVLTEEEFMVRYNPAS